MYSTSMETYPSAYDLRAMGKVTPVRDQGSAGSCWTFATFASLESCLLPCETYDFSENNMKNLLNNWEGSPYQDRFDSWEGGDCMDVSGLPCHAGVGQSTNLTTPTAQRMKNHLQDFLNKNILQEVLRLTNMNAIKDAIMNRGAVQTSFYWKSQYYNATDYPPIIAPHPEATMQ